MLKLQVKEPGEYLMIGDNVKVIFTGRSAIPVSALRQKANGIKPRRKLMYVVQFMLIRYNVIRHYF